MKNVHIFRWEDEYYAAYKKYSGLLHLNDSNMGEKNIVKASSPEKFVSAITKSADKLLGKKIVQSQVYTRELLIHFNHYMYMN